ALFVVRSRCGAIVAVAGGVLTAGRGEVAGGGGCGALAGGGGAVGGGAGSVSGARVVVVESVRDGTLAVRGGGAMLAVATGGTGWVGVVVETAAVDVDPLVPVDGLPAGLSFG